MYICKFCNYETSDKSGYSHHTKTKKHLKNKESFDKNTEDEKMIIEKQTQEIEKLKQKLVIIEKEKELELLNKDKEIEKLEVTAKIYKELSEKAKNVNNGIIINANTNNLNYVNKHFKNAPPLKKISNYTLNGIDLNDSTQMDKLMENIIYFHNNKCLHKVIGDHIIKHYKKDDLQLQSFHTTDVSRRKYLVKLEDNLGYLYDDSSDDIDNYNPNDSNSDSNSETDTDSDYDETKKAYDKVKIKKNKSKWTNDNNGVKLEYLLVEPITKKVIRVLKKKCKDYNEELKINTKKIPTVDEIKMFEVLADILKEIDKDKLKKNINNYIAPYFGLDKK
jgi:hypothetical protein